MNINYINIVVLGNWNKRIFTPNWISNFIADAETQFEGIIEPKEMSMGYKIGNIIILPMDNLLEIKVGNDIKDGEKAIVILNKILKELPHTPIKGIGFNINYTIGDTCNIYNHFQKQSIISVDDLTISCIKLTKKYENHILNLEICMNNTSEPGYIMFNFHYNKADIFNTNLFEDFFNESQKYLNHE